MSKKLTLLLVIMLLPTLVLAQGRTTAAVNGTVMTQGGEPLIGANVVAVHEPSGSTFGAATRSDGKYNITGLRVGGPYTITVTYIGYKKQSQESVFLALASDIRLDFTLVEEAVELAEIVTVAEKNAILSASNVGTANNISTAEIERLPTISRNINDFTRLTPQVNSAGGGQSAGGKNNRYNNFQVDGAVLNDAFGLDAEGFPTGQVGAQPISLDAIEEFNVEVAPFDVRSGSFAGGLINAVTRGGTNEFQGSAFFFGRNQSFVGDRNEQPFGDFDDYQTGFRFGGPLIKSKLFFFINGEINRNNTPSNVGPAGSGSATEFSLTSEQLQGIADISQNTWDYDPGGFDQFTNARDNDKIFARLDWNISDQHRLTARYNYVTGALGDGTVRSTSFYTYESSQFDRDNTTNSGVLQLNSTFGSNIANEARVSFTTVRDSRTPLAGRSPQVEINLEDAAGVNLGTVRLGVERFSQKNALDQDIIELTDNLMYFTGDHTITVGTHNEFVSYNNLFIQDAYGNYVFDSVDEYQNGTPTQYTYTLSQVEGNPEPRADWKYMQLGFYVQDEWKVNPNLNLTFGLRADIPIMPDSPLFNQRFQDDFGRSTSDVPSGNILWSPRIGFNYDLSGNRTTQLRGGAGIFSGTPPGVWLSNQYSNTGVEFARIDVATFRGQQVPAFSPDPDNQPLPPGVDPNAPQTTEVNITDTDFKMPQIFRANVGIDQQLPQGFVGTLEFLYGKDINEVRFFNENVGNFGASTSTLPDGRPSYAGRTSSNFTNVIIMQNTSEGYQWNLTARVQKQLNQGPLANLFGSLSYSVMDAEDINSGRSSRAISNWQNNETSDPNGEITARSDFVVRQRILGNLSYAFNYGRGFGTTFSLFYEGRSGGPFSYMYFGDVNSDGRRDNDLAFIPASADDIANPANYADIKTFIDSDPALQDAQGKIFERNTATAPWQDRMDLRIAQKIPSIRNHNIEVTLDILNVLNLMNSDWGQVEFVNFDASTFLTFNGYVDGKPDIILGQRDTNGDGVRNRDDIFQTADLSSRWQMQLGIRYTF